MRPAPTRACAASSTCRSAQLRRRRRGARAHGRAHVYIMDAARVGHAPARSTAARNPSVPSAILKYHNTELGRQIANDAMDVHGGKGIMLGPEELPGARLPESVPIAITVEGANILTRSLIIFGQGAIRCHPFVRARRWTPRRTRTRARPAASSTARCSGTSATRCRTRRARSCMALTLARFTDVPDDGPTRALLPAHQPLQRVVRASRPTSRC